MTKTSPETILKATLDFAKTVRIGGRFQAPRVRDQLELPEKQWNGEEIRERWRKNRKWLKDHGLRLIEEPKRERIWWLFLKE